MTKNMMNLYAWAAVILISILFVVCINFTADEKYTRAGGESVKIENMEKQQVDAVDVWHEKRIDYSFEITYCDYEIRDLAIYTMHQDIRVYIEDELIYERIISDENLFGKTPGCLWHFIALTKNDVGSRVRVEITSPYKDNLEIVPEIYLSNRNWIYTMLLTRSAIPLVIGVIVVGLGTAFIIYACIPGKRGRSRKKLGYLGVLALNIGNWQISEVLSTITIGNGAILVSYISYVSLLLLTIPFVMFVRELYSSRENKIWDVICGCSLIQITIEVICLVAGVADFREMLWSNSILYGMAILTAIYMVIREKYAVGLSREMKRNFVCLILIAVGIGADVVRYNIYHGDCVSVFGASSFLIYMIFVGIRSIQDANNLIEQGREANRFKKMAYHDSLTGVLSRAAFEEAMKQLEEEKEDCFIVMFDLNDLKKCNDTLGHKSGDKYIKDSAELICRILNRSGRCYRIGGDEFCVLIPNGNAAEIEAARGKINRELEKYNETQKDFKRYIACGYAQFDAAMDSDLNDTRGRADAAMYHNKFEMKKMQNSELF